MRDYVDAKIEYGNHFNIKETIPDFRYIDGKKQKRYMLQKRENDTERHGVSLVKDLLKDGKIKLFKDDISED